MLDYEWGNPTVMLSSDNEPEHVPESDSTRQQHHPNFFDHYANSQAAAAYNNLVAPQPPPSAFAHHFNPTQAQQQFHSLYDPQAYGGASAYAPPQHHLQLDPFQGGGAGHGLLLVPKSEDFSQPSSDFASRIGLNLGGRTYFSSEDDFMNRLYRRTRPSAADQMAFVHAPRCQAEGCAADLSHSKHYHRRHKVCEYHSKASTVIAHGLTQRFCQQCSRFHLLTEFDNGKRSCRKRLEDHNRRRRKSQQTINQENHTSSQVQVMETTLNSSSDNVARSPPDSVAHSASVVTVAVSPPRMTLDCFRQRPYQAAAATTSSGSSSSLFFSSG